MDFLANLLMGLDTAMSVTVIVVVLIILCWLIGILFKHRKDIMCALNQWAQRKQEKDELLKMVYNNKKAIEQYAENRIHDREQSFMIQGQLTDAIKALSEKLDAIDKRQSDYEEKHKKRLRAEIKDRIAELYRYYSTKKSWSSMEKEAFDGLIEEYESAGGENSFVHSKVQAESYLWKIEDL